MKLPIRTWLVATALLVAEFLLLLGLLSFTVNGTADGLLTFLAILFAVAGVYFLQAGVLTLGNSLNVFSIPRQGGELITNGIYSKVRHPVYLGLLLLGFGAVLRSGNIISIYTWVALLIVLVAKMNMEDRLLNLKFEGYEQYRISTPALIPKLQKPR